jgi:hypothetical protein
MQDNARDYYYNWTYYSDWNIDSGEPPNCQNRDEPRYFGSAGYYYSVSYDWGGGDSVADYNWLIYNDYQAGDIDTNTTTSCSRGVDCSGFISNVWEIGSKQSTCTLSSYTCDIDDLDDLEGGDILNDCGNHVVLFWYEGSGGVYAYEATTNHQYDRVVYDWEPWSRYNGYGGERFEDSCDACPDDS